MPPEQAPEPPIQGSDPSQASALCPRHGLRYDPRLSSGCVRCRRTRDEPAPAYAGPLTLVLLAVGLGVLAIPARTAIRAYLAPAPSGSAIPQDAPPEHRRCVSAEGTTAGLAAATDDCQKACEAGWGASCRRLAGICAPDAALPPGAACAPGPLELLRRACEHHDAAACALASDQKRAEILWKACDSGLGAPCSELAPLCNRERAALAEGSPTTAWAYFAHPALRQACGGDPGRLHERGCLQGDWAACEHPAAQARLTPARLREILERACDRADAAACRRFAALVHGEDPGLSAALLAYARDLEACAGGDCSGARRWRDRIGEERPRAARQDAVTSEEACSRQDLVASCWEAAEAYATGEGVRQDLKHASALHARARSLLKAGCGKPGGDCASADTLASLEACSHSDALACLAVVRAQGGSPTGPAAPLFRRATRMLQTDCDSRKGPACWTLADLHGKGSLHGGESAQLDLIRKGCDARHGLSCNDLALRSETGRGVARDKGAAERFYRRSMEPLAAECDAGERAACGALAEILEAGKGTPRDEGKAAQYRAKATPAPAPAGSR